MCSGEPCPDISLCEEEVYIGNSSMLSFVEVFRGDGLTNEDIFASCKAPVTNAETFMTEAIYFWNFTKVVPYAMGTPGYYIPGSKICSQGFENRAPRGSSAEVARDYTSLSSKCPCYEANAWPASDYLKKSTILSLSSIDPYRIDPYRCGHIRPRATTYGCMLLGLGQNRRKSQENRHLW